MRTLEELLAAYATTAGGPLDFTRDVWIFYLPYAHAQSELRDDVTGDQWAAQQQPLTRAAVLAEMRDYMEFAWGKAGDHRGISALRSVEKMQAWLWLLGDEAEAVYDYACNPAHYPNYGAPILKRICTVYGFPLPTDNPGVLRMAEGLPCQEGCMEGCG